METFDDVSPREVRSAAKKLVGPAPRPDQVQLAALQAVLDLAEQPLSERERDAVDAALAHARGALPAAAPLLDQGKCPALASRVLRAALLLCRIVRACCGTFVRRWSIDSSETSSMAPTSSSSYVCRSRKYHSPPLVDKAFSRGLACPEWPSVDMHEMGFRL